MAVVRIGTYFFRSLVESACRVYWYCAEPGRPPMPVYPHANPGEMGLQLTRDNYANEVRRLIEILFRLALGWSL